jgi:two-component system, cell cycle sensor histidine kinase and response regulator CckA
MLNRFSIRHVIVVAMSLLVLVAVTGITILAGTTTSMRRELARQSAELRLDEEIAGRIVSHARAQIDAAHRYAAHRDQAALDQFRFEGAEAYDHIRRYLFRDLNREERVLVENIRERHERIEVEAQRSFSDPEATALATLDETIMLQADLARLLELRRSRDAELAAAQDRVWHWFYIALIGIGVVYLAAIAAATVFLRRRLVQPLVRLSAASARVGAGDFDVRVTHPGTGELAEVATSFNAMAERLQRARVEAAHAEHRYRDLIEGLSTAVWEADAETFRCTYVSPQAERLFGYSVDEWMATDIWVRIIHPDDVEGVLAACREASAEGHDHDLEYRVVRADGTVIWVRDFVRVLLDETGRARRLRGVLTDITATRSAADALRESEERYHSLFDRVPVGLYRTAADGSLLDANPALVSMLGFDVRDDLLQANAADVYMDPSERLDGATQVERAGGVLEVDRQHRRCDGSVIWLRDTAHTVRDADGNVMYYEGVLQDVTARVSAAEEVRRSEARFRSLIENASDGVLMVSQDLTIQYQSPAVQRMLGYAPEELLGHSPFEFVHTDDLPLVREAFDAFSSTAGRAEGARSIEFRCRHRNGQWRVIHALGSNLVDDAAVGAFVINMIDMTSHRRLEAELGQAQKMEAIGRLAGGIAHDFNNLLTAIQGYADLLAERMAEGDAGQADLFEIRSAVSRAATLTTQLLAFSRRQVVQPRPIDVGPVIASLDQMLRRLITEDIPLHTRIGRDCWVHADPVQVEQIVLNLVVNARDSRPAGGITVSVENVTMEGRSTNGGLRAGDYVLLAVEDDGCGIEPGVLPHIFDPFFTTKDVGQGTGLGLATVYGIVEQCGGRILVDSAPGTGTSIRVYLPSVAPMEPARTADSASVEPASGNELVLLVEDEPAVRSLAERVLSRYGYEVVSATNGVHALELIDTLNRKIDLVVTDVVMPEMGGVQLAAHLSRLQPGLRILFISGYAADALPGTEDGSILNFLEKPFSPVELAEAVRAALDEAGAVAGG